MNKQLINIVICYKNEDEVINYGQQLDNQTYSKYITLVVVINSYCYGFEYLDNGLKRLNIAYEILDSQSNLGYLNGLLYGAINCETTTDWYIFSNTDILLTDKNMIESFCDKAMSYNDTVWLIGPSVYAPFNKSYSNPYLMERPSKLYYYSKILGMTFPYIYNSLFVLKRHLISRNKQNNNNHSGYVYAVHGSYFFIKRDLIISLLEHGKWELLYSEEAFIAEVLREKNKKAYYDSSLSVDHLEGTSTGKVDYKSRYYQMKASNKRILHEFY